jgi:hypothetical protein
VMVVRHVSESWNQVVEWLEGMSSLQEAVECLASTIFLSGDN